MDVAIRHHETNPKSINDNVLILVLVDVALRNMKKFNDAPVVGLNPCFSGCCTQAGMEEQYGIYFNRLNPCFRGCCTQAWLLPLISLRSYLS